MKEKVEIIIPPKTPIFKLNGVRDISKALHVHVGSVTVRTSMVKSIL